MHSVFELAGRYGVTIEYTDLGDWGIDELRSEYDPAGPTIRVNKRVFESLPVAEIGDFIVFSIAHELYHHREHCGEVPHYVDRAARENAANDFARQLIGPRP